MEYFFLDEIAVTSVSFAAREISRVKYEQYNILCISKAKNVYFLLTEFVQTLQIACLQ